MPIFLAPLYLLGAALAAAPVLMHLLHQRRPKPVPFSTLRFLRTAVAKTRRSRRITHLLILIMRVLILLLIAMAFARPKLHMVAWLPRGSRTVVIMLDGSASMRVRNGDSSSFDIAKQWAAELIGSLDKGDRVAVVVPGAEEPNAVFPAISDHAAAADALAAVAAPGYGRIDIVTELNDLLKQLDYGRNLTGLEVHLFSDYQESAWDSVRAEELDEALAEEDMVLFLNRVRPEIVVNAGIESVAASPPALVGEGNIRFRAAVQASPDFADENRLQLTVSGEELASRSFSLHGNADPVTLQTRITGEGNSVAGVLELLPDALDADNSYYVSLPRIAGVPLLLVEGGDGSSGQYRDVFFLKHAIQPGGHSTIFRPEIMSWQLFLTASLERYRAVLISNPPTLRGVAAVQLQGFVRDGGHAVIFPGDNLDQPGDIASLDAFTGIDVKIEQHSEPQVARVLPGQPPSEFEQNIGRVLPGAFDVTVRKRLAFSSLPADVDGFFYYADGTPFMISAKPGSGRISVGSISAARDWSEWPLSPFFVIVMQELVRSAVEESIQPLSTTVGGTLAVDWPLAVTEQEFRMQLPGGAVRRFTASRTSANAPLLVSGFQRPGLYELSGAGRQLTVAVNLPRGEGALLFVNSDKLASVFRAATAFSAGSWQEQRQQVVDVRHGRPLWPLLLVIAFMLALCEEIFANYQSRAQKLPAALRQLLAGGQA